MERNHYTFNCPIKGGAARYEDCSRINHHVLVGNPEDAADKKCAVACLAFMCPFRNAHRVAGPWWDVENKPVASSPMETPAELDEDLVAYSLLHTLPKDSDYRRVGLKDQLRIYNDELAALQEPFLGRQVERPKVPPPERVKARIERGAAIAAKAGRSSVVKTVESKATETTNTSSETRRPATALDAVSQVANDDLAQTVNEMVAQEKSRSARESAQERPFDLAAPQRPEKPASHSAGEKSGPEQPARKLSLTERAKLMKERRQQNQDG